MRLLAHGTHRQDRTFTRQPATLIPHTTPVALESFVSSTRDLLPQLLCLKSPMAECMGTILAKPTPISLIAPASS